MKFFVVLIVSFFVAFCFISGTSETFEATFVEHPFLSALAIGLITLYWFVTKAVVKERNRPPKKHEVF